MHEQTFSQAKTHNKSMRSFLVLLGNFQIVYRKSTIYYNTQVMIKMQSWVGRAMQLGLLKALHDYKVQRVFVSML